MQHQKVAQGLLNQGPQEEGKTWKRATRQVRREDPALYKLGREGEQDTGEANQGGADNHSEVRTRM